MSRSVRPLLNLLLALVLFAQGFSAAASGRGIERPAPSAAAAVATAAVAATAMDHCQRMQASSEPQPMATAPVSLAKASCCDAACPDMLSCTMASLALPGHGALTLRRQLPPLLGAEPALQRPPTRGDATFRPPIVSSQA